MTFLISKKFVPVLIISLVCISCSVAIKSVVDKQNPKTYENALIVIPKPYYFNIFVPNFKRALEDELLKYEIGYEFLVLEPQNEKLELNSEAKAVPDSIIVDKDLILYVLPRNVFILNNLIRNFDFEIIGTSAESKKEVWKSFMEVKCQFGPSSQKEKIAQTFLAQLEKDGVIRLKK